MRPLKQGLLSYVHHVFVRKGIFYYSKAEEEIWFPGPLLQKENTILEAQERAYSQMWSEEIPFD